MFKLCALWAICFITIMKAQENPHKEVPFSCETCHNTDEWQNVKFDHSKAGFELEGQHLKQNCTSCHTISNFSKVDRQCKSCHLDVHQTKLYPECESCHTALAWTIIDPNQAHANTTFQLIGTHAKLDCWACHRQEVVAEFRRPSSDCYECHQKDFMTTTNPKHDLSTFGIRCEDCHSFLSWSPATFDDHDSQFPIFSGSHSGVWDGCTTCHINPATYQDFSCLNCHAHRKSEMDDEHEKQPGYSYDSRACYNCHPGGRGD